MLRRTETGVASGAEAETYSSEADPKNMLKSSRTFSRLRYDSLMEKASGKTMGLITMATCTFQYSSYSRLTYLAYKGHGTQRTVSTHARHP